MNRKNDLKQTSSENFDELFDRRSTQADLLDEYGKLGTPEKIKEALEQTEKIVKELIEERKSSKHYCSKVIQLEELLMRIFYSFELDEDTKKCIEDTCDMPKQAEGMDENKNS